MYQNETYILLLDFMHKGGPVMWLIALLAVILCALIFERLWYLFIVIKAQHMRGIKSNVRQQEPGVKHQSSSLDREKKQQKINANLNLIKTLVLLCPLLGLLGTVSGMISVFDVIAFGQLGDVKLMADGVSKATLPTMASMVVSISGIFAHGYLLKKADKHKQWLVNRSMAADYA